MKTIKFKLPNGDVVTHDVVIVTLRVSQPGKPDIKMEQYRNTRVNSPISHSLIAIYIITLILALL